MKKAYGNNADNMQTQEELARMREYALKEMDRNKDAMISLEEFMSYATGEKFADNEEWKPVADEEEVCVCVCVCECVCVCVCVCVCEWNMQVYTLLAKDYK